MNTQGTSGDMDADHAIEHRHFSGGLPRLLHAGWGQALARLQRCQSQGHVPGQIQAWLDVADLHLGVGSLGRAQQALVQAQQLHRMDQRRAVPAAGPSAWPDAASAPSSAPSSVAWSDPSADLAAWSLILHAETLLLAGRGARDELAGPMVGAMQLAARALAQWPDVVWACGSLSRWPQARASAATSHALLSVQCGADAAQAWAGLAHSQAQGASAVGPWQQLRRTLAEAMRDNAQGGQPPGEAWPPAVNTLLAAIAPDWRWVALATQGLMISEWPHGRTWAGPWRSPMARWLHQLGPELEQSEPAWPLPPVPAGAGNGPLGAGLAVATLDELSSLLEPWLEEWAADWLVWWPADGLPGARWDALSRRWRAVAQDVHSRALAAQARPQSVWSLHCLEQAPLAEETRRELLAGAPQASALAIGLAHGSAGWRGLLWVGRDRWTLWHPTQAASAGAWLAQALGPAPAAASALSLQPTGALPPASWPGQSNLLNPGGADPQPGGEASTWTAALRERLQRAESLASLGSLVGGFAHDLNSPLGVILTSASLLDERAAQVRDELEQGRLKRSSFQEFLDATAQSCQLMLRGTERASRLVRHFKQLAVEALDEHRVAQPLAGAADDVAVLLRDALAGRGHRLDILGEWEGRYDGPPGALSQVLLQLVRNASAHAGLAPGAPIVLQARRERGREGGPGVCIEVRDQGRGMTPAEREAALTRPFSRDPDSVGGMGLFLAHELVTRALGGELQVGEGPQGGLLVQLWLPWQPD